MLLSGRQKRTKCCGIQTASIDTGWLVLREQLLISPQPTPLEHFSHIDLASYSPHTLSPDSNYHTGKIISITQINQKRVVSFLCQKSPDFTQMPIKTQQVWGVVFNLSTVSLFPTFKHLRSILKFAYLKGIVHAN